MAYKTFNRFLKSLSIKKKLTYTLIPVILVTYLLSVGSVYMVSFHETKSIVNQQAQTLANQRTQLVDSYLDQLRTETEIFMFDTAFQKRFRTNRSTLSLSQQEELNKEITQYMYSMIISYNVYVESITLINNHLDSYNWHMDGRNSYSAYISRLLSLSDTLTELDGGILYTYDKLDQGVVTIARLIKDPIYDRKIGIFMLDFNLGFLNGLLSAAFYLLLSYFLPANTSVAVETSPLNTAPMAGSAASSLALIALSMFFLLTCILRSGKTPSKICGGNSTGKMLQ